MAQYFKVKLYRSPFYIMVHLIIVLVSLFSIFWGVGSILFNLLSGVTWHELFYKSYENSLFFDDVAIIYGTIDSINFIFGIVFYVFVLIISMISLVGNKIVVYNEYIKIQFAPRYLKRYINLKNIIDIIPIQRDKISLFQRIANFNFSKNHLYKITTKHNETIIISCVDESNLERLKQQIDGT